MGIPAIYAQATLENYPGYIQYRVYAVAKANQLNDEKILKIANYFENRDKQVQDMIKRQTPVAEITSLYNIEDQDLQKILSPKEFANYMVATSSNSMLLKAIALHSELSLSDSKVDTLLRWYNTALSVASSAGIAKDWEERQLFTILSNDQLYTLIKQTEKKQYDKQASLQWHKLVKLELSKGVDSNKFKRDYLDYQFKRSHAKIKLKVEKSTGRKETVDMLLYSKNPFLMRKMELYEGTAPENTLFTDLMMARSTLKLNGAQVDSLVNCTYQLMSLILDYNKTPRSASYPSRRFEYKTMSRILTEEQFDNFLQIRYSPRAEGDALATWAELEKSNLITGLDKKKVLKELTAYELNKVISKVKSNTSRTREAAYEAKRAEASKPEILIALEGKKNTAMTNSDQKRSMAW